MPSVELNRVMYIDFSSHDKSLVDERANCIIQKIPMNPVRKHWTKNSEIDCGNFINVFLVFLVSTVSASLFISNS